LRTVKRGSFGSTPGGTKFCRAPVSTVYLVAVLVPHHYRNPYGQRAPCRTGACPRLASSPALRARPRSRPTSPALRLRPWRTKLYRRAVTASLQFKLRPRLRRKHRRKLRCKLRFQWLATQVCAQAGAERAGAERALPRRRGRRVSEPKGSASFF
jgi:hypothetical protein